jgi:hypothetical protein
MRPVEQDTAQAGMMGKNRRQHIAGSAADSGVIGGRPSDATALTLLIEFSRPRSPLG